MTITPKERLKKELELLKKIKTFTNLKRTSKKDIIEYIEELENEKIEIIALINEKNV